MLKRSITKKTASAALFATLSVGAMGFTAPAFAEVASDEQAMVQEQKTVEALYEDLAALQADLQRLAESSEVLSSDPAFQAFSVEVVAISEQHATDIVAAGEVAESNIEAGANIFVARDMFEDTYNRANSNAFNSYHQAKDALNAEWNSYGMNDELKNEFNDAYNNALAEVSNILEQIKALLNASINADVTNSVK